MGLIISALSPELSCEYGSGLCGGRCVPDGNGRYRSHSRQGTPGYAGGVLSVYDGEKYMKRMLLLLRAMTFLAAFGGGGMVLG